MKKSNLTINAKVGKSRVKVCEFMFDLERLAAMEESDDPSEMTAKKAIRKLYNEIVQLNDKYGIVVVRNDQNGVSKLGEIRAQAIIAWKKAYASHGFGDYEVSSHDAQMTFKQAQLVLHNEQLEKYMKCTEWYAEHKILSKYVSAEMQNRLNQKEVESSVKHPDSWDLHYYATVLKSPNTRTEYIKHLIKLGFVKKNTESGILCYVKPKTHQNHE